MSAGQRADSPVLKALEADDAQSFANLRLLMLADIAVKSLAAPKSSADEVEHRNRKAAVDVDGLRHIGDVARIETMKVDLSCEWLENTDNAPQQRGFPGAIRTNNGKERALRDLAAKMMHGRMAVVTERQILKLNLCAHADLSVSRTMIHNTALTAAAIPNRAASVIRNIDQRGGCDGCGDAGP